MNPKETIIVHGEKWDLHKSATDSTIPFAYDRVKAEHFACEEIDKGVYIVLVGGYIPPRPNSLEKAVRIMLVGFSNMYLSPQMVSPIQLQNMHVYKADTYNMAKDFAKEFFAGTPEEANNKVEITPFPKEATPVKAKEETKDDVTN
jgi:hypothetical protein